MLWTIQPLSVWIELNNKGHYICDEKYIDPYFKKAYNWLVSQMEYRIGERPKGVTYPIWAWHTMNWKHKKPDLRESGYGEKGTKCVCMEIEVPDNEVLLSDFDAWHSVLNDGYFENSKSEEEWGILHNEFDKLSIEEQKRVKLKSWNKIFDISPFKNDWVHKGEYIQATFWVLYLKDVKRVQFFTSR